MTPPKNPPPLVRREDLEAAVAELHATRESIDTAVKTAVDDKTKKWRNVAIGLGVGLVIALAAAGLAGWAALAADDAAENAESAVADVERLLVQQEADLLQRRIDACERDNVAREGHRLSNQQSAQSATNFAQLLIQGEEIDAELADRLARFQEQVVDPFLRLADPNTGPFAPRDCSPAGIEEESSGATTTN